jgi:hypothetical protein
MLGFDAGIREEIRNIETGKADRNNNVLKKYDAVLSDTKHRAPTNGHEGLVLLHVA